MSEKRGQDCRWSILYLALSDGGRQSLSVVVGAVSVGPCSLLGPRRVRGVVLAYIALIRPQGFMLLLELGGSELGT